MTLPTCSMCGVVALDGIADDALSADGLCGDCASYVAELSGPRAADFREPGSAPSPRFDTDPASYPAANAEGERLLDVDPVFGPIYETATTRVYREVTDEQRERRNADS